LYSRELANVIYQDGQRCSSDHVHSS